MIGRMNDLLIRIEARLNACGPLKAADLARELGVSQPTISRALTTLGPRLRRIGRARATRYALVRNLGRDGHAWPLYRINAEGRPDTLGRLSALSGSAMLFEPEGARPALTQSDFRDGFYPDVPWFLDDQRPQGFLGRAFARSVAALIGANDDPTLWTADDRLIALLYYGHDGPGDLVLGDRALDRALSERQAPVAVLHTDRRQGAYPQYALDALRGEPAGSSAGGKQPKFTAILETENGHDAVIVKFSDAGSHPAALRWRDLLICEHLALELLGEHGIEASRSELLFVEGRAFLQSQRFDRTPALGRRGFITLAPCDAAFFGHGRRAWSDLADGLHRLGWLDASATRDLQLRDLFGSLIANTDRHLGNAGMILTDTPPFALAPVYDMLPMHYRPNAQGEVIDREFAPVSWRPATATLWPRAATLAMSYWNRVATDVRISAGFQAIARGNADRIRRLLDAAR